MATGPRANVTTRLTAANTRTGWRVPRSATPLGRRADGPRPLSSSRLCSVEGLEQVLDGNSLAGHHHPAVAAHGRGEGRRPAVLVDDDHGRGPGLDRLSRSLEIRVT